MVYQRILTDCDANSSVLGKSFKLPTSKRVVKNRFVKSAISERLCTWNKGGKDNGIPSEEVVNLYEKWGNGGFGMIITGNVIIDENSLESAGNMIIDSKLNTPERMKVYKKVAKAGKTDGALMIVQLGHAGRMTPAYVNETPFSSCDIQVEDPMNPIKKGKPIQLTKEQIKTEIIDKMVYATKYCYDCGFDGVEIHGGFGFLLAQFLSDTTNKRNDEYGGSIENKLRIIVECYKEIRKKVPVETGFSVGIKLTSTEFQNEELSVDDIVKVTEILDNTGFDFIEISGGSYEKLDIHSPSDPKRDAYFEVFSKAVKNNAKKAIVIWSGGFRTVKGMVACIEDGLTDCVSLGRPITNEPDLPKKILKKGIKSSSLNLLEAKGFYESILCSFTQVSQMSKKPIKECNDIPSFEVMDISNPKVAAKYGQKIGEFFASMSTDKSGKNLKGIIEVDFNSL